MKLNIAFKTLLAAICTASKAHARVPSHLRDPRTVEEKEEVHRQTMGDHVLGTLLAKDAAGLTCEQRLEDAEAAVSQNEVSSLEEAKSLACTVVSTDYSVCQGCQGFSQVGKEVHIPGCVGMTSEKCKDLADGIVGEKPDWFKNGEGTTLVPDVLEFVPAGEMSYYKLGLPVSAIDDAPQGSKLVTGVAGNCMVYYAWDWCVLSSSSSNGDSTVCLKLQPWDCSGGANNGCLNSSDCCAKIQDEYPKPDINGNELQCYEWVLPVKSIGIGDGNTGTTTLTDSNGSTGSSGGVTGNRLVIHLNDGKVALPAVITDGSYEPVHDEEIIVTQPVCPKSFPNDLQRSGAPTTLKAAVAAYVSEGCATDDNCAIGEEWGWPINSWCVDQVTSFSHLFEYTFTFNEDVNGWTTSQVTNMAQMFYYAYAFNQPLDNWDTSSVTNMQTMFYYAYAFNQPLDNWDTSSVTNMQTMFYKAKAFNQPLDNWDTSSVTNMAQMFYYAKAFNQPLGNWDTSSVTTMYQMFYGASAFNQPLGNWDTSSVTSMEQMFRNAAAFNQPLDNWDTSSVTNMQEMFYEASAFNQNLCQWGNHFNSGAYNDRMFSRTACPNTQYWGPTSVKGPWCHVCP